MSTEAKKTGSNFGILLTTSLVSSLIMLDSNIVAVSLPAIARSFNATFTDVEWVVSAYLLSYSALLLAGGAFADLWGRKKAMTLGLLIFGFSSLMCGWAGSSLVLNVARATQGVGGSLLLTAALAIISNNFTGAARGRAFAVWGACLGIALTSGPLLGGLITTFFGWPWIFLVNIPICLALVIATVKIIPESRDPQARRIDYWGIASFSPGLFLVIWALIDGNDEGWLSTAILLRFAGSLVFLVIFVAVELRQQRPMIDFGLFKHSTFIGAVVAMIGYGLTAQVMIFYLPLFLQNAYGFTPAEAGLGMLPFALPMALIPPFAANLLKDLSGRVILTVGLSITLLGNLFFWMLARSDAPYPFFLVGMLIAGTGTGILNGETVKVVAEAVPANRAGMASGIASTTRFIGILVGVALLGAVISNEARRHFVSAATAAGLNAEMTTAAAKQVTSGNLMGMLIGVPEPLQARLHTAGDIAFANGFATAALLAALLAAGAAALTLRLAPGFKCPPVGIAVGEGDPVVTAD
jgi:EmrB/QacA subfamily drug resistance transporter